MKGNDFSAGSVKGRIMAQAIPLTLAQVAHLLYNIVDRIYIGHLPDAGSMALTGLGVTFPVVVLIAAFTCLFGQGGTPLFAIARGRGDDEEAENILGNVFALLSASSVVLFVLCYIFRRPILLLFGASEASLVYADAYLQIYLLGTLFSMLTTGLNGFINAQGYPKIGMLTTILGAVMNIVLDPIFIFVCNMGVRGAALATVISQGASCAWVMYFLTGQKAAVRITRRSVRISWARTKRIMSLGCASAVMQGTNCLVQIACNTQLQLFGGDLYVGIMTVLSSVREIMTLPVSGVSSGAQPVISFNYGAGKPERVKESIRFTTVLGFVYTLAAWLVVMLLPRQLISIFSSDEQTIIHGAQALNIYFFGFVFMAFQLVGQTTFLGLGRAKQGIFFSLLRKAFIVTPLTFLLPRMGFGVLGVFLAEPISNAVGSLATFITMWRTVYRRL